MLWRIYMANLQQFNASVLAVTFQWSSCIDHLARSHVGAHLFHFYEISCRLKFTSRKRVSYESYMTVPKLFLIIHCSHLIFFIDLGLVRLLVILADKNYISDPPQFESLQWHWLILFQMLWNVPKIFVRVKLVINSVISN